MAGLELPISAIRAADHLGGRHGHPDRADARRQRRVTSITELWGTEGETMTMQDIFTLDVTGAGPDDA